MRLLLTFFLTSPAIFAQMHLEKEAGLGAQLAKEIRRTTTPVENPAAQRYVERIGGLIAAQFPDFPFTWTFAIVEDDFPAHPHELRALPGGYIFVPSPRMVAAASEADFARLLAHAMAHLTERHWSRAGERRRDIASIPLIFMSPYGLPGRPGPYEAEAEAVAVKTISGIEFDPSSEELRRIQEELRPRTVIRVPRKPTLLRPNEIKQ